MQVNSNRFGLVEIDDKSIISFTGGIPGFEELEKFAIINCEQTSPIQWMISTEVEHIAIPVINPFIIMPDYNIEVNDEELELIQTHNQEDIVIFNVMVLPEKITDMTLNLMAPIIVNVNKMLGIQVMMDHKEYEIKYKAYNDMLAYYNKLAQEVDADAGTDEKK